MGMVTGYDCYKAMTEMEQVRWQRNVIRRGVVPSNILLEKTHNNFCCFIESSFSWSDTNEGTEYWATICEKYKVHDQLIPGEYFTTKPPKTF